MRVHRHAPTLLQSIGMPPSQAMNWERVLLLSYHTHHVVALCWLGYHINHVVALLLLFGLLWLLLALATNLLSYQQAQLPTKAQLPTTAATNQSSTSKGREGKDKLLSVSDSLSPT